jgi:dihydropyrimidinase
MLAALGFGGFEMKHIASVLLITGIAALGMLHESPRMDAQTPSELIIRRASIVNADGRMQGDIRVRGEKILEIGRNLSASPGAREFDANGLMALPGAVDPHVHPVGSAENLTTTSASALAGGVTTISHYISPAAKSTETLAAAVSRAADRVKQEAMADFMVHVMVNNPTQQLLELEALAATGQPSIKIFMDRPLFDANSRAYVDVIRKAGELGLLALVHCEDDTLVNSVGQDFIKKGKGDLRYYAEARPVVTEEAATHRCVAFSEITGAPVYVVHISSERALRAVEAGKARGLPVFAEVRQIYLYFTDDVYQRPDVGLFIGRPPMRKQSDVDYMWKAIARGSIDVVDTDHSGYTREEKLAPQTVLDHRAGMNSLQIYLPMMWSTGVRSKKITAEQFVAVTAANPAQLMGLFPQKGRIAVGSDADIVLWDPNETRTVRDEDELSAAKHTIYAGKSFTGWPKVTIRRGDVVWENRQIKSVAGSGKVISRQKWQKPTFTRSSNTDGVKQ